MLRNIRSLFTKLGAAPIMNSRLCGTKMENPTSGRLVWLDLEMTGLDVEKDHILEVACIVTDSNLNVVAEGPNLILKQTASVLSGMNEWCVKQHGKSGLTEESQKSNLSVEDAEEIIYKFISEHVIEHSSPLAGNSVYMDRIFLRKYMPKVNEYLHYRIVDVSTVKELCRCWNSQLLKKQPQKNFQHRALDDIKESIAELKFYKDHFFKSKLSHPTDMKIKPRFYLPYNIQLGLEVLFDGVSVLKGELKRFDERRQTFQVSKTCYVDKFDDGVFASQVSVALRTF